MKQILACLSPSPSNPKILHAAADLARGDRELIALFVETPAFSRLSEDSPPGVSGSPPDPHPDNKARRSCSAGQ